MLNEFVPCKICRLAELLTGNLNGHTLALCISLHANLPQTCESSYVCAGNDLVISNNNAVQYSGGAWHQELRLPSASPLGREAACCAMPCVQTCWVAFASAGPWNGAAGGMCGGWQCGGSSYLPGNNGFVYTNPGLYNTPALIYPGKATLNSRLRSSLHSVAQSRSQAHMDTSSTLNYKAALAALKLAGLMGLSSVQAAGSTSPTQHTRPHWTATDVRRLLHCQKLKFFCVLLLTAGIYDLLAPQAMLTRSCCAYSY